MQGMNNIALNEDVYEQLKESCDALEYKEPEIDIKNEISDFVETLQIKDDHVRDNELKDWIIAKVQPILTAWERKYAGGDKVLNNIHTEINKLENIKQTEQINIDNIGESITTKLEEKARKETAIKNAEDKEIGNKKIDIKYEKMKAVMFLVFSFLVAFGTYTYFIKSQIEMDWATKSQNDKISSVVEMIQGGEQNYFITFKKYLVDSEGEPIKDINQIINGQSVNGITRDKIFEAPSPSILQGIKYNPSVLLLSIAAFLLILFGKITASVYERLKYPNWMYYILFGLAFTVLAGAVISNSSLNSLKTEKTFLVDDIKSIDKKIEEAKFSSGSPRGRRSTVAEDTDEVKNLKEKLQENKEKLRSINESIGSYKFLTMLLFMFAEIVIGSIAWITYAEYINKKQRLLSGGLGYLNLLKSEREDIEENIKILKAEIEAKRQIIIRATDLETKLSSLVGYVHSKAQIKNNSKQHMDAILADGTQILQKARMKWQKEGL